MICDICKDRISFYQSYEVIKGKQVHVVCAGEALKRYEENEETTYEDSFRVEVSE